MLAEEIRFPQEQQVRRATRRATPRMRAANTNRESQAVPPIARIQLPQNVHSTTQTFPTEIFVLRSSQHGISRHSQNPQNNLSIGIRSSSLLFERPDANLTLSSTFFRLVATASASNSLSTSPSFDIPNVASLSHDERTLWIEAVIPSRTSFLIGRSAKSPFPSMGFSRHNNCSDRFLIKLPHTRINFVRSIFQKKEDEIP